MIHGCCCAYATFNMYHSMFFAPYKYVLFMFVQLNSQAEVSPPICYVQLGLSTISPDLLLQVKEPKPTDLELA